MFGIRSGKGQLVLGCTGCPPGYDQCLQHEAVTARTSSWEPESCQETWRNGTCWTWQINSVTVNASRMVVESLQKPWGEWTWDTSSSPCCRHRKNTEMNFFCSPTAQANGVFSPDKLRCVPVRVAGAGSGGRFRRVPESSGVCWCRFRRQVPVRFRRVPV